MNFCPNCLCPACIEHSRILWEHQQEILAEQARRVAKLREQRARDRARRTELLRQAAMIWMLTNHASNSDDAFHVMNDIARALDVSPAMINARRVIYVTELNKRAGILDNFQWKPPGTRGMDEPALCEKCGGIGTRGKRCRRSSCR